MGHRSNLLNAVTSTPRPKGFRTRGFEGWILVATRRARVRSRLRRGGKPSPRLSSPGCPIGWRSADACDPYDCSTWMPHPVSTGIGCLEQAFFVVPPSQRSRRRHMTTATTTITSQTQPGMAANRPNTAEITPPRMPRKAPKATSTTNARSRATKQVLQERKDSSM